MSKNGGNVFGIEFVDGLFYIIHVVFWWEKEFDDDIVYSFIFKVLICIQSEVEKLDVVSDYIYMNYVSIFENVIVSYGFKNVVRFKSIVVVYDLIGVF